MSSCSDVVSHMSHLNKRICIAAALTVSSMSVNINLLYKRLGHPAIYTLKSVLKTCNPFAAINKVHKLNFFNAYQYGKSHLKYFSSVESKTSEPLQLLYGDLGDHHLLHPSKDTTIICPF